MSARWIDTTEGLLRAVESFAPQTLAVDTEADSLHHYPEKVCLVQISAGGTDLLIDPLAGVDLSVLGDLFEDSRVRKVLHGADYDLRLLGRDFGLRLRGLFDTMLAARLVGERKFGLAALLAQRFGVELDKRLQRADWSRRPLPDEMLKYAAMDTQYLEPLADQLEQRLVELGRSAWAREEFARLEEVRWDGAPDPEAFRRVKGSASLTPSQLAILRELHRFRESEARRRDRPPFRILHDELLLKLAREAPRRAAQLAELGLPRSWSDGSRAGRLLRVISRAFDLPDDDLPQVRRGIRPPASIEKQVRALCGARDAVAHELDLEPSVVAPRAALTRIVEAREVGEDGLAASGLRNWQIEQIRPLLER